MKNQKMITIIVFFFSFMSLNAYSQIKPILTVLHDGDWDHIGTMAFSPDGTKLLTGMFHAYVWDIKSGTKLYTLPKEISYSSAVFSADNSLLVTGSAHLLTQVWDSNTGNLISKRQEPVIYGDPAAPYEIDSVAFVPKQNAILQIDHRGYITKWNYITNEEDEIMYTSSYYGISLIFIDSDRFFLANNIISMSNKKILFTLESGAWATLTDGILYSLRAGNLSGECYLESWNKDTYEKIQTYPKITRYSTVYKLSPDAKFLMLGGEERENEQTQILDIRTSQTSKSFQNSNGESEEVDMIVFSPNGKLVALACDNNVYIYDISDLTSSTQEATELKQ